MIKAEAELSDSEFDKEKAQERVAKLGGAIGRIKVGAATETELKDKKLRCVAVERDHDGHCICDPSAG